MHSRPAHIDSITGLRGFTILSVVFAHFSGLFSTLLPEFHYPIAVFTSIGFRVDFLLLLSGFIAAYVFVDVEEHLTARKHFEFLKGRFVRLYPSYLAALIALVVLVIATSMIGIHITGDYSWRALPVRLMLMQAWPGFQWTVLTWNYPTWFISALWFAYLLAFPLGWSLIRATRRGLDPQFVAYGFISAGLGFRWLGSPGQFEPVLHGSCQFLAGMSIYALFSMREDINVRMRVRADWIAALFVICAMIVPLVSYSSAVWINRLLVLAIPPLLLGIIGGNSLTTKVLSSKPLQALGVISYSVFLSHALVQKGLKVLIKLDYAVQQSLFFRMGLVLACLTMVTAAGCTLYLLVEAPCRRRFRSRKTRQGGKEGFSRRYCDAGRDLAGVR